MINTDSVLISDEKGVEVLVGFEWERESAQVQEVHGFFQLVGGGMSVTLTCMEIVIAGKAIDILPLMNEKQIAKVINNIDTDNLDL